MSDSRPTCKGIAFTTIIKEMEKDFGKSEIASFCQKIGLSSSYRDFSDYPAKDFVNLLDRAYQQYYSNESKERRMYGFGQVTFKCFAESFLGKIVLKLYKRSWDKVMPRLPEYYSSINKHFGEISVGQTNENTYVVKYQKYKNYPVFHLGLIEEALKQLNFEFDIALEKASEKIDAEGVVEGNFELVVKFK